MNNHDLIIIALVIALIYLYYQNQKLRKLPAERILVGTDNSTSQTLFEINDEEKNEELIADKDAAVRAKNETEQELISVSNKLKLKNQEVTRKD